MIKEIVSKPDKLKIVSDIAFQAIDEDDSNTIDEDEFANIMKDAAILFKTKARTENEISSMLQEMDENSDGTLNKTEFEQLIMMTFKKLQVGEEELIESLNKKNAKKSLSPSKTHEYD